MQKASRWLLLWHAGYHLKDSNITEKDYDRAQNVIAKLKIADETKWALKDQIALYKQKVPRGLFF